MMMVSRLVLEKGCQTSWTWRPPCPGQADFVHVGPFEHDQSDALSDEVVAAASASGTVTFVGAVDDVRPYLASADLVVLPSYREGIPRAVMEAAVMGRPVVAYDIRGVREVLDPRSGLRGPRAATWPRSPALVAVTARRPRPQARRSGWPAGAGGLPLLRGPGGRAADGRLRLDAPRGRPAPVREGRMTTAVCLTVDVEDWYDGMAVLGEPVPRPDGARSGLDGLASLLGTPRPAAPG